MNIDISYNKSLKLYPWLYSSTNVFYVFAIIYFVTVTNSYVLATTLFSIKKISTILAELPTWVISDKYLGRKWTYIFWQLSLLISFSLYFLWDFSYIFMVIWAIFQWISNAFHSGNMDAMLHNILNKLWKNNLYQKYNWRSSWISLWGTGTETLIAWLFFLIDPRLVLVVAILKCLIWLISSLFIKEAYEFEKSKTLKESWNHFTESLIYINRNPKLRLLSFITIFRRSMYHIVDEIWFVFYQKFYSTLWIWILFGISTFIAGFWSWFSHKITNKLWYLKTFVWADLISVSINSFAYIFPTKLSPIIIELSANCTVIENTSERTLLQNEYTNNQRATMESIISIFSSILYSILIIIIWFIADLYSLEIALLTITLCRLILIPFYFKFFNNKKL